MRFHDHRTSCGQRRGRIATCYGEGEREIACTEHRSGTKPDLTQANVRATVRLAGFDRGVDTRVEKLALADDVREQAKLAHRAGALPFDARSRQAGLGTRSVDELFTECAD